MTPPQLEEGDHEEPMPEVIGELSIELAPF